MSEILSDYIYNSIYNSKIGSMDPIGPELELSARCDRSLDVRFDQCIMSNA